MKNKKIIVASVVGMLGVTSMVIGAITFAGNTSLNTSSQKGTARTGSGQHMNFGSGQKMDFGSGQHMRDNFMDKFSSTGDAEAFRTAIEAAYDANDYKAFVAAYTKYDITSYPTEDEFNTRVEQRAKMEKIKTAVENGDYSTRKTLNEGNPILEKIDTEAKFKKYQEMYTYQEKARTIAEELEIGGSRGNGMGMEIGMGDGMGDGMGMGKGPRGEGPKMDTTNTTTTNQ